MGLEEEDDARVGVACWTLLGDGSNGMMYCSLFPYLLQSSRALPDLTHISGQDYHLYVANYVGVATWKKICKATLAGWLVFLSRISLLPCQFF